MTSTGHRRLSVTTWFYKGHMITQQLIGHKLTFSRLNFYRAKHIHCAVLLSHAVCQSVTLVNCDHMH